tara:strand:- start:168 stop:392 length:225 start_codon:yes stop_codon:yes gene_type:complete
MKIQLGDLVHFRIKAADIVLQEGFGIIMKKADPDLVHMDKHSRALEESWIIYAENRFWFVREKYFLKVYKASDY